MAKLKLERLYKVYDGRVKAVNDLSLEINHQDFIVFVGPSGCGKSTTLRMIAGLEEITSGKLYIDDVLVNEMPPKDRDIAMVFQSYALYPHKTVYENMAFGLRMAGLKDNEIKERIYKASDILELTPYLTRKPKALSGGQKQRVALGRSIVREPKVFLLDEPLSNLDAKLRVQMRSEITKLHRRLGTTFIYVTHDQVEAMTMGNRIVVIKDGYMQQIDSPTNLYDHPDNVFVATFLGTPQMNIYNGVLKKINDNYYLVFKDNDDIKVNLSTLIVKKIISEKYIGKEVIFGIRPEDVTETNTQDALRMVVEIIEKRGSELIVYGVLENTDLPVTAKLDGRRVIVEGDVINVKFDEERLHLFDKDSEKRIAEVITYNYLPATFESEHKQITLLSKKLELNSKDFDSILPEYKTKKAIIGIKIPTDAFSLVSDENHTIKVKGIVKSVEEDKESTLIFFEYAKNKPYLSAKLPVGNYKVEDVIELYLNTDVIELFDETFNEKLTALHPITSNITKCIVKNKNGKSVAKFGSFSLQLDEEYEEGEYMLMIPYDSFEIVHDRKEEVKGRLMKFKCVNESSQGNSTILYANLKEFPDYISIKAGKDDTCFTKGKLTFNIKKVILTK